MVYFRNFVLTLAVTSLSVSCSSADFVRIFKNYNLKKKGITLDYAYVPAGLYGKPFIIEFESLLKKISMGEIDIEAYNTYTVGDYEKISNPCIKSVTNFYDPMSKFKDTWFGVYIVMDDNAGRGKIFMLKNQGGDPGDPANLKVESMLLLPEMDQKIIVQSSHQNQKDYSWKQFERDFHFNLKPGTNLEIRNVTDRSGRSWLKVTGTFDTIAALTDTSLTNMKIFSSIRSYAGLPNEEVYALVDPWHPIEIKGSILGRYFPCTGNGFWAVVYYNGTAFTNKKGQYIDTWEDTDLQSIFQKMFDSLTISCR